VCSVVVTRRLRVVYSQKLPCWAITCYKPTQNWPILVKTQRFLIPEIRKHKLETQSMKRHVYPSNHVIWAIKHYTTTPILYFESAALTWYLFCPRRWHLSSACLSLYGLKSISWIMTIFAAVRLIPSPPALVDNRKMNIELSVENLSISSCLKTRVLQFSTSCKRHAKLLYIDKTITVKQYIHQLLSNDC